MKTTPTAMLKKAELPYDLGHTLDHARRVLGANFTTAVNSDLRTIVKANLRMLRRYGWAGRNGNIERARSLEYLLANAFGFRIMGVLHGYPKGKHELTWAEVKDLAAQANPRLLANEPAKVFGEPKPEGGVRSITTFGRVQRANQSMARDIIHVRHGQSKYEYARKGRGREALITDINNANRNGGVRALGTLDVKYFFPSINRAMVYEVLHVSKAMIDHTLFVHDHTHVHIYGDFISEHAVRAGLPQGALSSVIVAGKVIEPCLDKVPARFIGSNIDDVTIGDKSVGEVQALLDTLTAALEEQYPGSPLFLKFQHAFKIGSRADILGYWPRPNPVKYGGALRFSPSEKAIRRHYVKVATELLMLPIDEWPAKQERMAYAWAASFKNWGGMMGGREFAQTAFGDVLWPILFELHDPVQTDLKTINDPKAKRRYAAEVAHLLVPECVLVREVADAIGPMASLCDPLPVKVPIPLGTNPKS